MTGQEKYMELSDLQGLIKMRIGYLEAWVRVEIESHNVVRGHHYLNVIEKTRTGGIAAKAGARIWSSNAGIIAEFQRVTGKGLEPGMSVVVRVQVDYHPQFGLGLTILEIDPGYSIGLRELERQETIRKLAEAGLMETQKALELPFWPSSIAVISSGDAAGYGDFKKHLDGNQYGFKLNFTLFQSLVQGENAPSSIIGCLDEIRQAGGYDAVVILRGGGSNSDLFCFDDYGLCKAIAGFPLPVFTAIGHERDYHVADMVANSFFKTPTALADYFVDWTLDVEGRMEEALESLCKSLRERLFAEESRIEGTLGNIKYHLSDRVNALEKETGRTVSNIHFAISATLQRLDTAVALLDTGIKASDPRGILRQGYVLAVDKDGTVLKNVRSKSVGDGFSLRFADGRWDCTINGIKENS